MMITHWEWKHSEYRAQLHIRVRGQTPFHVCYNTRFKEYKEERNKAYLIKAALNYTTDLLVLQLAVLYRTS